jgi:hypothetical protein
MMASIVVYLIISIILFMILLVLFRKQVKIKVIQLKHGKYSYNYVKQFKKYANKSPFPYCFKDDIMPYLRLTNNKKDIALNFSSERILLCDEIPFNTSLHDILKTYGNPDCFNAFLIKNIELRTYGYFRERFNAPVKVVFFFINESLVMGEYIIDDLSKIDIQSVAKIFLESAGVGTDTNSVHFFVNGKSDTTAYFYENGFSLLIRFMDDANTRFNELKK